MGETNAKRVKVVVIKQDLDFNRFNIGSKSYQMQMGLLGQD
jgi:hypothetical protein